MYTDEELKELTVKVLQKLDKLYGYSEAEVFIQSLSQMMGGLEYRTPKVYQSLNRAGCAIRFFKGGKLFFACFPVNSVLADLNNLSSITTFPIESSKFEFPEIKLSSQSVSNIYDKRIAALNEEEIYSISYSMSEEEAKIKDIILDGSILLSLERKVIANSSQSVAFEKSTWFDIDLRALYSGFDMISSSEKHLTSRQIPSSVSSIVEDLVNETIQRSTVSENLDNFMVPVVFSPMAFSQIFSFTLIPLLKQGAIENLDRTDISPDFNLIDDGTVPGLPNSTAFDDEGVNQSKTVVVRNGIYHTPLNNSQSIIEKEERTGNSFRVKMFEFFPRNYQAYPEVYPSNLLIGEGTESFESMIEEIKSGVFVNSSQGYMTADPYSGTFKVSANDAYKIENGFITGSLPTFDVIGNMFDVISKEPVFSKDRRVVRPSNTPFSVVSPFVLTNETEIFL